MAKFRVLLEPGEDGGWVVTVPSLPGCFSQGKSKREALENIREAIACHVEATNEAVQAASPPAGVAEDWVEV